MKKIISVVIACAIVLSIIPITFAAEAGLGNFKKTNTYAPGMFKDVFSSDWYATNVISAYQYGLVKGTTATNFNPKGNITVAETIALACRLHNIYNGGTGAFTQGNPWYKVYVDYALANKIIPGTYSDYNAKISRANFAKIMANALPDEALAAINNIPNGKIPDVTSEASVYRLYRAGVLTGSDKYGTFNPNSTILRSEVATIVTRMADKTQRKTFVLENKPLVPQSITLSGRTTMNINGSGQWKASIVPAGANQWVSWTSGNTNVATIDANGNIKALKAGQTNITATAVNGVKKTVLLTVKNDESPEIILKTSLPKEFWWYTYSRCMITNFRYESAKSYDGYRATIYVDGQKTYDINGSDNTGFSCVSYRLFDTEGYLAEIGTFFINGLSVGDKVKDYSSNIYGLKTGTYYLELCDYK